MPPKDFLRNPFRDLLSPSRLLLSLVDPADEVPAAQEQPRLNWGFPTAFWGRWLILG